MKKAFSYILDTIRLNSQTILAKNRGENPRKSHSGDFLWKLALGLVLPHIIRRRNSPTFKNMKTDMKVNLSFLIICQSLQSFFEDFPPIVDQSGLDPPPIHLTFVALFWLRQELKNANLCLFVCSSFHPSDVNLSIAHNLHLFA